MVVDSAVLPKCARYLGLEIDSLLKWEVHVQRL